MKLDMRGFSGEETAAKAGERYASGNAEIRFERRGEDSSTG